MVKEGTTIIIVKGDGKMSINVEGHHYEPIVCAGISAIMQTAELGLKAISNSHEKVEIINMEEK